MEFKLTKSKHGGGGFSLNNKNNASSKHVAIILGIFALVIVTTAVSYAFFTYSRVGETVTTITSGDIEFSYIEGTSANLANAFPVSDSVGAQDTTGEYTFDVRMSSSSTNYKMNYNVILVDNNNDENTNYFKNEQIKFALLKDETYVANTSETTGVKLSTIPGFSEGSSNGYGYVLQDQEIISGKTDNYKLRIWISDDVTYSDEIDENGTMTGKYNSYKYSLKVKVTSGIGNTTSFDNIETAGPTIIAELSDPNGLDSYAVTTSSTAPADDSNEWIDITDTTAKSKVMRLASNLITKKTIRYEVNESGTYYLHVKNKNNEVSTKEVVVTIDKYTITFDGNGGTSTSSNKEVINNTTYGELPGATRTGYIFDGWYTSQNEGEKVTASSNVDLTDNQTLYARWISKTFADKAAVLTEFTGTTAETIMCEQSNDDNYYNCDEMTLVETGTEERDGTIFLLKDVTYTGNIDFNNDSIKTIDFNNNTINGSLYSSNGTLNLKNGKIITTNPNSAAITIEEHGNINVDNIYIIRKVNGAAIWGGGNCNDCKLNISNSTMDVDAGLNFSEQSVNSVINVENSKIISSKNSFVAFGNNKYNITNCYISSETGFTIRLRNQTDVIINGDHPTFDSEGNYLSGTYIYSNSSEGATIQVDSGTLKVNGGYIYHDSVENGTWRQKSLRMDGGIAYLNGGTFESMYSLEKGETGISVMMGNAIVKVNGAKIKDGITANYDVNNTIPNTTLYICKGEINSVEVISGSYGYIKSSGITWGTQPTFSEYIIQDDTITCSE